MRKLRENEVRFLIKKYQNQGYSDKKAAKLVQKHLKMIQISQKTGINDEEIEEDYPVEVLEEPSFPMELQEIYA